MNMGAQKDGIVVEKDSALDVTVDLDMEQDSTEGQPMTFPVTMDMGKSKTVEPGDIQELLTECEARRIQFVTSSKMAGFRKLFQQLAGTIGEKYSNHQQQCQLFHKVQNSIKRECQRMTTHKFVASNRHCSQLKKVWRNRGLSVDEESLKSAAASKDAFDMRSLSESLPSEPLARDEKFESEANKLARNLLLMYQKDMALTREKIARGASNAPELNNNLPSSSSQVHRPLTLTSMVKKVCRDMKNIQIFSLRPPVSSHTGPYGSSKTIVNSEGSSVPDTQYVSQRFVLETIGNNPTTSNPTPLFEDLPHYVRFCESRKKSYLSVALRQQMSRQKMANSKRDGLSEDMDESEVEEASFDQNNDKQDKATAMLDRKKERRGRLLELLKDTPCVQYKPVLNRKE